MHRKTGKDPGKKQVQRKTIHLVTSFSLYVSINTMQIMFYDIPHLYVGVKGEEGMGADDFLVLTKGQFSLYDISSDSLKVEP